MIHIACKITNISLYVLVKVTASQDLPFHQLQQLQCLDLTNVELGPYKQVTGREIEALTHRNYVNFERE